MSKTKTTTKKTLRPPTLTLKQLEDKLRAQRGATFATLVTRTVPGMKLSGNPFRDKVFKVSRVNGVLNFIYGNSVNRQRGREGKVADFRPEPRKWGSRISGTTFVEHKGKLYIELKVEQALGHEFVWADGTALTPAEVARLEPFLRQSRQPETQGTDKEIILRDYSLENVVAITMSGTQFVVVPMT